MEFFKKYKKVFIYVGIVILVFFTGFGTGRFCRIRGAKQSGTDLEQSVNRIGDQADRIKDLSTGIDTRTGELIKSTDESIRDTEQLRTFTDELAGIIELNERSLESSIELLYSTTDGIDYLKRINEIAKLKVDSNARLVEELKRKIREQQESTIE